MFLEVDYIVDHADHVQLLKDGIPTAGGRWAEFGSGRGAFTLALAELLGSGGRIYSIDRDGHALNEQARSIQRKFSVQAPQMHYLTTDFTKPISLPRLDGILMANSLHFQRNKKAVLGMCLDYLHPGGRLIVVEYNVDQGNHWVPYPISFKRWQSLAKDCGFVNTECLAVRPSRFLGEIYSAVSDKPAVER